MSYSNKLWVNPAIRSKRKKNPIARAKIPNMERPVGKTKSEEFKGEGIHLQVFTPR